MNETTQMTFTPDQLDEVLGYEPSDRRIYFNDEEGRWECKSGYGDYVLGWLEYNYLLRQKLNLLTPKFTEMFDQLIDYIEEEGC
jgi:recombinational DNA repair ATPase RecF